MLRMIDEPKVDDILQLAGLAGDVDSLSKGFRDPLTNRNAKASYNPPSNGHDECVLPGNNIWGSTEYDNYWS
jgi:hypothetical protein